MNVGGKIKLPGHYLENLRAAERKRHTEGKSFQDRGYKHNILTS